MLSGYEQWADQTGAILPAIRRPEDQATLRELSANIYYVMRTGLLASFHPMQTPSLTRLKAYCEEKGGPAELPHIAYGIALWAMLYAGDEVESAEGWDGISADLVERFCK